MGNVLISALAIGCVLTAVETFFRPIGKWRGLLSLLLSVAFCILLEVSARYLLVHVLAATFAGLTLALLVEQVFIGTSERDFRNLPKRVTPR